MDRRSSTGAPEVYPGERQASVSSFLTSVVLLAGILGGLVIVVTVILVCKYCQGHRKPLTRQTSRSSRRDNSSDRYSRCEHFYSDILSEPSSCSVHGSSLTPRSLQHFRYPDKVGDPEFATETIHLKCDLGLDDYSESAQGRGQVKPPVQGAEPDSLDPSPQTVEYGGEDGSRYNEGGYHLKHSKIGRSLPRQFSMGGAGSAVQGRILLDDPQFRFSSLDERLTTHSGVSLESSLDGTGELHQQLQLPHLQQPQLQHPLQQLQHPLQQLQYPLQQLQLQHPLQQLQHPLQQLQHPLQQLQHPLQQLQHPLQQLQHPLQQLQHPLQQLQHPLQQLLHGQPADEQFALCRDKRESPSLNSRTARSAVTSLSSNLSSTLTSLKEDTKSSSLPSVRPIADFLPGVLPSHSRRGEDISSSTLSQFKPIKEGGRSAFTIHRPVRTQVSVEVHQHAHNRDGGNHSANSSEELHQRLLGRLDRTYFQAFSSQSAHWSQRPGAARPVNSHSLESPRQSSYRDSRQVRSHDDYLEDYDVLKITEFSKGPFYNTDYDIISDLASPTSSKVRYNDTGSLEQLNEDSSAFVCGLEFDALAKMEDRDEAVEDKRDQDHSEDTEDSAETLNGNRKYRALWRLRATLEEEEECSDTVRMEDLTSPDDSFEREHVTPNTTSFESNAQSEPCPSDHRDSGIQFEICSAKPLNHVNFLHPNYENRRQNYRNVRSGRFNRGNQSTSVENSFDSVETDGDISDTSRYEMTTTSFESSTTTDNTDSTNESQASKLVQMKADSGYKSLENQQQSSKEMGDHEAAKWDFRASVEVGEGIAARRDRRTSVERGAMVCYTFGQPGAVGLIGDSGRGYPHQGMRRSSGTAAQPRCDPTWRPIHATSHFTRRDVKTASKKRREYSRERQLVHVCESIHEPASELRADSPGRDRPEDSSTPNKISVFARFFRSHPRGHRSQYLTRDYSIDQKTNSIFNEFVRQEMPQTVTESGAIPRGLSRHRLQRKHTEPALLTEARSSTRDRLAPNMRSASLGSESSASSARRMSPQDSIEEKDDEMADETIFLHRLPVWSSFRSPDINLMSRQVQTLSLRDIPAIKLSEQEAPEIS